MPLSTAAPTADASSPRRRRAGPSGLPVGSSVTGRPGAGLARAAVALDAAAARQHHLRELVAVMPVWWPARSWNVSPSQAASL